MQNESKIETQNQNPMDEPHPFDPLLKYAKENGLACETHLDEKRLLLSPNDPFLNTKYITIKKGNLTFCTFDSYGAKLGSSQTFAGIYCAIRLKPEMELELSRKHWSDHILVFNKRKTDIDIIDRNFTLSASKEWNFQVLFSEKEAHLFMDIEKQIKPLKLIIQHNYISIISELKDRQVIGMETNQWISRNEDMDCFLNQGAKLIENIIRASERFF